MEMTTVEVKGYVVYDAFYARHGCDGGDYQRGFTFLTYRPQADKDKVVVREHTITIEVPVKFDPRPGMVENLKAQKEKARADFAALVVQIDRQINELLALEA